MITRNTANGTLSATFITRLQTRVEAPLVIFRFQTDSTTDLNEDLNASETVFDVDDSSVFTDDDIIKIDDELMLVTDDAWGANQIQVSRAYGTSIAATHSNNEDIYIMTIYQILSITDLSIDPDFGANEAVVEVSNADQSWNIFLSAPQNHGKSATIELKFDALAETMALFTGVVDHVEFSDVNMSAFVYLSDRLTKKLDETIGSARDVIDWYTVAAQTPDIMVWELLTTFAGLDNTPSQDNIDIDYSKLEAWTAKTLNQNLSFKALIPKSHTYRSAIQMILYLSQSWAFITNEGKVGLAYRDNDAVSGDDTWTQAQLLTEVGGSKVDGNRPYTDLTEIINWQNVAHGYDPLTGIWASETLGTAVINVDNASQALYGLQAMAEADVLVWHDDVASATGGSDWFESIHSTPKKYSELFTWLYGFRTEPGDVIDLTDADYAWTNELIKIEKILSINLIDFTISLKGRI